ncbi:28S ribosomal protein S22, mitochondrial [Anopheles stephensi]|uniref:28S ribosomal protein S22, mitochondrial n=1 Tax=Anopheles stephensi TaxID=30069 RepID=UPI001658AE1D|nr:28S ribosomal protein S22, mitochondrial [Anopheles stephensi]
MWKMLHELRLIGGLARRRGTALHNTPLAMCRLFSSSTTTAQTDGESFLIYDKDPAPAFMRDDVQQLLKSITRLELEKVFRKRSVKDNTVEYRFMTDEQLRQELLQSIGKAQKMLQMPPVVQEQKDNCRVISKDGALKALSTSKFVFTDITYGLKNSQRSIVVRHPDGTLQEAPYEMRKRLNQIYFPLTGRSIHEPPMFEHAHLLRLLEEGKYEFVLDRACVQFEPYEKDYHQITAKVYQHVNESRSFDALRSTRHFGPFAFFLAWHKLIDDLLLDMIKQDYLRNGIELIVLYSTLHGTALDGSVKQVALEPQMPNLFDAPEKSIEELKQDEQFLSIIEQFVNEHATKKVQLSLAVQAYREMASEKIRLAQGIRRMHGES